VAQGSTLISVDYALTASPVYTIPTYRVLYNRHPILPNPRSYPIYFALTMLVSWQALRAISPKLHPSPLLSRVFRLTQPQPGTSTRRYYAHQRVMSGEDDSNSDFGADFFGTYSIILPPEPFVLGVSHISQRPVPKHIPRPSYVTRSTDERQPTLGEASDGGGDGRIRLGSSGERRLRQAARLARDVLEYAGTLVKVKAGFVVQQANNTDLQVRSAPPQMRWMPPFMSIS
jgi:hypothetical protein